MKKVLILVFVGGLIVLSSCNKETEYINGDVNTSVNEMVVPANFDWKTTREVSLTLTGYTRGMMQVTSTTGVVYQTAQVLKYQPYAMKITVPAYEKSVLVTFGGESVKVNIESGKASHRFTK